MYLLLLQDMKSFFMRIISLFCFKFECVLKDEYLFFSGTERKRSEEN